MKLKKHYLLAGVGLLLVLSSLLVPGKANDVEEVKNVGFGFPLEFVFQDFTQYNQSFSFFPRYFKIEPWRGQPIASISILKFLLNWVLHFAILELLIDFLERINYLVRVKLFNSKH